MQNKSYYIKYNNNIIQELITDYIEQNITLSKLVEQLKIIDTWAETEVKFHSKFSKTIESLKETCL